MYKKKRSLMLEPDVIRLGNIQAELQELKSRLDEDSLKYAQLLYMKAEEFAKQYTFVLGPTNFMLRLNHESLDAYRIVQDWANSAASLRNWALGAEIILTIGSGKKVDIAEAKKMFEGLSSGMTPINGALPSFLIAMDMHGQAVSSD